MASIDLAGYHANATIAPPAAFGAKFDGWSASVVTDTADYAAFGSQWMNSKLGTGQVTGSATGTLKFNAANTAPVPDPGGDIALGSFTGSVTFTAFDGCTITGTFNFTNVTMAKPDPGGKSEFSCDMESDGEVQIVWDES